jgi:hypothetical protein
MLRFLFTLFCFSLMSLNAQATTVLNIDDGACDLGANCWTATVGGSGDPDFDIANTGKSTILAAFAPILGSLTEVYKTDSADPGSSTPASESGSLSGSYTTTYEFIGGGEDYRGATISYDGSDILDCSVECYLLVKDGNKSPAAYLFNLALGNTPSWDGTMDLILQNFWVGQGSISHVALYGNVAVVPVPAAFWLFGTALIGFIGFSRRTKV